MVFLANSSQKNNLHVQLKIRQKEMQKIKKNFQLAELYIKSYKYNFPFICFGFGSKQRQVATFPIFSLLY